MNSKNVNLEDKVLKIPRHIGIIMDGNRRWARAHHLPALEGHRRGLLNVKKIVRKAIKTGVKILTIYAFSTENWHRDQKEVDYLMKLFKVFLNQEIKSLIKDGIKVNFFGRLSDLSSDLQEDIRKVKKETEKGLTGILNICFSYGGRDELVRTFQKIVKKKVAVKDISQELIKENLDSAGLVDPDLIIRTSGEQRLSGFLTWQSVYSELYFTKKYWPEFGTLDLVKAIKEYGLRQRRFGRA